MSGISKKMLQAAAGSAGGGFTAIEDVFSTYLYTGNNSTQTITNGVDLAGEGGLVWIKSRSAATDHQLFDTERGATKELISNSTAAEATDADTLTAFNADGFSLGADSNTNTSAATYASWTFRKAPRFFDVVTYTGTGATQTINHGLDCDVGCIIIKRTDTTGNWQVGFPEQGSLDWIYGILELTNSMPSASYGQVFLGSKPTETTIELIGDNTGWNASGGSYVMYLFAHDPLGPSGDGSDGLISCGGFTTDGSGRATVNLGWEPQFVIWKPVSTTGNWEMNDQMRGWNEVEGKYLFPDTTAAEGTRNNVSAPWKPTATGIVFDFSVLGGALANTSYIYIAIRRGPMRVPESGTEVFKPSYGLNASNSEIVNAGFPIDLNWRENVTGGFNVYLQDRMRGFDNFLSSNNTNAEAGAGGSYSGTQNGIYLAATLSFTSWINWSFRRAPNFFDVVAYTGTGANRTVSHNLGAAPELMIVKKRSAVDNWVVYAGDATDYLILNSTAATADLNTMWNDTAPTSSVFSLGTNDDINGNTATFIAYLFATLPGVSKVGSYTGNGSSQTINCGFTTGARFILIKRTDSTGDWYVWDTARGIVTGTDPHLSLNTSTAEVTTDDSIDTASSGFIVNQLGATNINVSAASYIFYAVA